MGMNIDPNKPDMLFFSLPPPGSESQEFTQLAVDANGVPIGDGVPGSQTVAVLLGYSGQDTIESAKLDEVLEYAKKLNIGIANPMWVSGQGLLIYFEKVNPAHPTLPPLSGLAALSQQLLTQGNIGGVTVGSADSQPDDTPLVTSQSPPPTGGPITSMATTGAAAASSNYIGAGINDSRRVLGTQTDGISFQKSSGGNPWLAANAYVAFLTEFAQMQRVLMRNKEVQGRVEIASMHLIVDLAKTTAKLIMDIAKTNQAIHITTAVMSACSLVISYAGFKNPDVMRGSTFSAMGGQLEKMTTATAQSATDISIAEKEGRKEVLQAYRTIVQRQMDRSGEAFKASEEAISQLIQALDKIREGLNQAVAAALRK